MPISELRNSPRASRQRELRSLQSGGRELVYSVAPAESPSSSPVVVAFHGHRTNDRPTEFRDSRYTVVAPLDTFGYDGLGSWWLGEAGDLFLVDMISEMVRSVKEETGSAELFTWGISMGGYGAILHGLRLDACAVFAHVPQTLLQGSQYAVMGMDEYFEAALGPAPESEYNDLCRLVDHTVESGRALPLFMLSANRFDLAGYLDEQVFRFTDCLQKHGANFALEIHPVRGHGFNPSMRESIPRTVNTYHQTAPADSAHPRD